MAGSTKVPTRRDLEDAVVKRALLDESFRNQLKNDARGAVEQVLSELAPNAKLPKDLEVKAIYEPQDTFSIVVPHTKPAGDLTDDELEQVAGGRMGVGVVITLE